MSSPRSLMKLERALSSVRRTASSNRIFRCIAEAMVAQRSYEHRDHQRVSESLRLRRGSAASSGHGTAVSKKVPMEKGPAFSVERQLSESRSPCVGLSYRA
jgi:hypothetical protein